MTANWEDILEESNFDSPSEYLEDLINSSLMLTKAEMDEILDELLSYGADSNFVNQFKKCWCNMEKYDYAFDQNEFGIYAYVRLLIEGCIRPEYSVPPPLYTSYIQTLKNLGFPIQKANNGIYKLVL